jgi:competence protein ComEA
MVVIANVNAAPGIVIAATSRSVRGLRERGVQSRRFKMRQVKKCVALWLIMAFFAGLVAVVQAEETQKININLASVEELALLARIGSKYAQRIVAYREEHGPFSKPEDIMKVPGVGERIFQENQDRISVE